MKDFKCFNLSVVGASHLEKNTVMQDSSASFKDEKMALAIVSDGHGSKHYFRSDKGSALAVEAAEECMKEFVSSVTADEVLCENNEAIFVQLEKSIIARWNSLVHRHYSENPFTEEELELSGKYREDYLNGLDFVQAYGATLIAVAVTEKYWFGLHIGDGICVAIYEDGNVKEPIPWDEKCHLNVCTSICDKDASKEFRYFCNEKIPVAVYVGSDGIDDSFGRDYSAEKSELLYNFYRLISLTFAKDEFEQTRNNLKDYLSQLSEMGSRDDVSVAGIFNLNGLEASKEWLEIHQEAVKKKRLVKSLENELEKAEKEENEEAKEKADSLRESIDAASSEYEALCEKLDEILKTSDNAVSSQTEAHEIKE